MSELQGRLLSNFKRIGFERARRGQFTWSRGEVAGLSVETPCFMPVGTQASVRSQRIQDIARLPAPIILGNTFHLMRNPGLETLRALGGVKRLNGWKRALLTDSGGYQVFSLAEHAVLDEKGVRFRYGEREPEIFLSPETSVAAQQVIGSDIMMVFDQCIASTADLATARAAMELTHRWAQRSIVARTAEYSGALFGIVQGACHAELRRESALTLAELCGGTQGLDGLAIGGLAVGESKSEREEMTAWTEQFLPEQQPRYLMGVGTPIDLLEAVARGMDLFDCVMPTLYAQQGVGFTWKGRVDLRRGIYRLEQLPLDPDCPCETCQTHTRAYLRHLIRAREVSGWSAIGAHNLYFYTHFMQAMRDAMDRGEFAEFYYQHRERVAGADLLHPVTYPA